MAMALKQLKCKKGLDYYTVTVAFVGVVLMIFIAFSLFTKYYYVSSGLSLGSNQFKVLKVYGAAEKALLFVDESAKTALGIAAYAYGKSGFFTQAPKCGALNGVNYWTKGEISNTNKCVIKTTPCYPEEGDIQGTLLSFFDAEFSELIGNFNNKDLNAPAAYLKIPYKYEPFTFSSVDGKTEVLGTSKEPITIESISPGFTYKVKPSFRERILVDVIGNSRIVIDAARQLANLKKDAMQAKIDELNSQSQGNLRWKLDYSSPNKPPCEYNTGIGCSYPCGTDRSPEGGIVTVYCPGTEWRVVSYDDVSASFSVAEGKKVLTYNYGTGRAELNDIAYDFGLSRIDINKDELVCRSI